MTRDVARLQGRTFDLLVVGGGIYGLAIAYDAAQRGLDVALVECDDFGSGSSFNHLRTIHGGLRYLQTLDLARARESVRERRTIARIAPHTVMPQVFVLPLTRSLTKGRLAMRAGFLLDRMVAFNRNAGVSASLRLPGGRVTSRAEVIERYPGVRRQHLTGAAVWCDLLTLEPDRLTISFGLAAAAHGAVLANYAEATALLTDGRRVVGARVTDRLEGGELDVRARLTVNATGGRVAQLLAPLGMAEPAPPMLKTMNLVTRRVAEGAAIGARTASGRTLFLVPWRGRALFGTWESATTVTPDALPAREDEVRAFIGELNDAFAGLDLRRADVSLVHRGVVPATVLPGGRLALEGHEQVRDHSTSGVEGLLSVAGTKYTTARAVAEGLTTRALAKLGRPPASCRTASVPLPGGDLGNAAEVIAAGRTAYDADLPPASLPHLVAAYGSQYERVLAAAGADRTLRAPVADESPVVGAQLAWAAREEMAVTLTDAVVRRTPLGALGYPGDAAAERAAGILGTILGWNADRRQAECDRLRAFYAVTAG